MRLIDADEIKKVFGIGGDEISCKNCKYLGRYGCIKEIPINDVCCFIDDAPTVDAIPVEWIKKYEKTDDLAASIYRMLEAWGVDMSED